MARRQTEPVKRAVKIRSTLPPGQRAIDAFPRFGLSRFARRYRKKFDALELRVSGETQQCLMLTADDLKSLPRIEQVSDFHCVTGWSKRGIKWAGYRFRDVYDDLIKPKAHPRPEAIIVEFTAQDGFRACVYLEDLMQDDVLLADRLDSRPLSAKHGAPLRLVSPGQYGYKSIKHIKSIDFRYNSSAFKPPGLRFMDHPRARVANEERGRWIPGIVLRLLYRPLIRPTIRQFQKAMVAARDEKDNG